MDAQECKSCVRPGFALLPFLVFSFGSCCKTLLFLLNEIREGALFIKRKLVGCGYLRVELPLFLG